MVAPRGGIAQSAHHASMECMTWLPSARYPDPAIHVLDASFRRHVVALAAIERLHTGTRWGEGPVWFGDHRCLVWSDIPNDRMLRWDEESGAVTTFRRGGHSNGSTRDRQGRLITCEHSGLRVVRTEPDGKLTVLCAGFDGKRLNAPNDVVVKSDGSIWFTDPAFAQDSPYIGRIGPAELPGSVYRIDGQTGAVTRVTDQVAGPNGLAFSPDESLLYVIASRAEPRDILAFPVQGAALGAPRILVRCGAAETPDGFRVDIHGNLWCGWGMGSAELDGVRVFNSAGAPIGHIALPERCANLCFGGPHRNRLFMAGAQSLFSLYVEAQGLPHA